MSPRQLINTQLAQFVSGVALLGAGVALLALHNTQVGAALISAGLSELGIRGLVGLGK